MRIEEGVKLDYKDVLIVPKRSTLTSRSEVNIGRKFTFKWSGNTFDGIPIVASNMDQVGTMSMARALLEKGMMTALHKHYAPDVLKKFYMSFPESGLSNVFYTMGIVDEDMDKLNKLLKIMDKNLIRNVCIDAANGYTERFVGVVKTIREKLPNVTLMAGNVVTPEMTEQLILSGADIVKVGIGSGSACITRKMAGVGYPELSAVIECADAAHGIGGHVAADGGCEVPGDVVKAFGGGADFVMLGGMLSGHTEGETEIVEQNGEKFMKFYGSSSEEAMVKWKGGVAEYRASEGKSVFVPFKGPVEKTIQDILGGLRSACTYVGAKNLKELPKRTTFVRVTQQLNPMFGE